MKNNTKIQIYVTLFLLVFMQICMVRPSFAAADKAVLIIVNRKDPDISAREDVIKKYLREYRKNSGNDQYTLPVFVYDYSREKVATFCREKLGVKKSDLLFIGVASVEGGIPTKLLARFANPEDLSVAAKSAIDYAAPKIQRGSLTLNSEPQGAKVYIDGKPKGSTPLNIEQLRPGTYSVVLKASGYKDYAKKFTLKEGESGSLSPKMIPSGSAVSPPPLTSATLTINSNPTGAVVYVNSKKVGRTPLKISKVAAGTYEINLKKGDLEWNKTIEITSEKKLSLDAKLAKNSAIRPNPGMSVLPAIEDPATAGNYYSSSNVGEAFLPRYRQDSTYRVTVSNIEETQIVKDFYKPRTDYKFIIVYLSQQNITSEFQVYPGTFKLKASNLVLYTPLEQLSNLWISVLRPGGMNMGYLVFEVPESEVPLQVELHTLKNSVLSVPLK